MPRSGQLGSNRIVTIEGGASNFGRPMLLHRSDLRRGRARRRRMGLAGEGDWFDPCGSPDCESGRRKIALMQGVYDGLGKPEKYRVSVDALLAAFNAVNPTISLFSSKCCAVRDLGAQAERLMAQMTTETGVVAPVATTPPPSSTVWTGLKWGIGLGLAAGVIYGVSRIWSAYRAPVRAYALRARDSLSRRLAPRQGVAGYRRLHGRR